MPARKTLTMNACPHLVAIALASNCFTCFAQQEYLSPVDTALRSNVLARTGGFIQKNASGPTIFILNTQTHIPPTSIRETSDQIRKLLRLNCTYNTAKTSGNPETDASKVVADNNIAAAIVICESATEPALLVAPEGRWVLVNVAKLGGVEVSTEKLDERVQKEIWRALGFVMGAANSNSDQCLLKPVFEVSDLDACKVKILSSEPFIKIMKQAQQMGMKPGGLSTYRKAVEEGWAPSPTTDIQRAICNELKNK